MYDCCYRKQDFPVGERLQESGCVAEAEKGGVKMDKYVFKWRVCWIKDFLGRAGVERKAKGCGARHLFSQHAALFV